LEELLEFEGARVEEPHADRSDDHGRAIHIGLGLMTEEQPADRTHVSSRQMQANAGALSGERDEIAPQYSTYVHILLLNVTIQRLLYFDQLKDSNRNKSVSLELESQRPLDQRPESEAAGTSMDSTGRPTEWIQCLRD
jgi:hypothetical protein